MTLPDQGARRVLRGLATALVCLLGSLPAPAETSQVPPPTSVEERIEQIDRLLNEWQFPEAKALAEGLLASHPDLPAVQFAAGWVKFHLGEHQAAAALVDRAGAAFKGKLERDPRVGRIRAMARIMSGYRRQASRDGRVEVWHAKGVDRILVPDLIDTVERTLDVVGEDLGHRPKHKIVVQVLPGPEALADATGLTADEIRTSGTIAVCKFGRLMVTSPRTTLKGYSYLDTASHELIHLIISQKTRNKTPIWIHEALAKYEDNRWRHGEPLYRQGLSPMRQSNLARALLSGELITFEQMHPSMALLPSAQAAELAFSEVYTVTAFLLSLKGYAGIRGVLERLAAGRADMEAIEQEYGLNRKRFVDSWLAWLRKQKLVVLNGEGLSETGQDRDRTAAGERSLSRTRRIDLRDLYHLGQLLRARGQTRAAAVEYTRAHRRAGPMHVGLWVIADKLGQVMAALGRREEARRAFEDSLRIHPEGIEAHFNLGRLLAEDDPWLSFLHLREASRLNPVDPRVHGQLVGVCTRLADRGDTRQAFKDLAIRHRIAYGLVRALGASNQGESFEDEALPDGKTASLRVISRPWARVWLDYRDTGLTTPVYNLPVSPGNHVLGLRADCREDPEVIAVSVEEGETEVIDLELCPPEPQSKPSDQSLVR